MEWLNYHHLFYFWTVARRGSVVAACAELKLRQPTVSAQVQALEAHIGEKLFDRIGRKLVLTETGRVVFRYAEQIFQLGSELIDVLHERPRDRPVELVVGITDVVPKLIAYRLIQPALVLKEKVKLVCREDATEKLLTELAMHNVDIIISDSPVGASTNVRAYSHLLGECGITFVASQELAEKYRKNFPQSLHQAPMLLPTDNTSIRGQLDMWFHSHDIVPETVGEFEDSALQNMFGKEGRGVFIVPTAIEKEVKKQYEVDVIGRAPTIKERFYLITVSRKIKNPAVIAISEAAKSVLQC